jgi:hypothetical protein
MATVTLGVRPHGRAGLRHRGQVLEYHYFSLFQWKSYFSRPDNHLKGTSWHNKKAKTSWYAVKETNL